MLLNQIHAAHTVARTSIAGSARCQAIGRILVVMSCQLQFVSWQFVAESCTSGTAEAYICRMIHHEWVAALLALGHGRSLAHSLCAKERWQNQSAKERLLKLKDTMCLAWAHSHLPQALLCAGKCSSCAITHLLSAASTVTKKLKPKQYRIELN